MPLVLYPVACNAREALLVETPRAARESDAYQIAQADIKFASDWLDATFETREAALDAYRGWLDDDRSGHVFVVPPEGRFCALACRPMASPRPPKARSVRPVMRDGRRWPEAQMPQRVVWQLNVSYWKILSATEIAEGPVPSGQARQIRSRDEGRDLSPQALKQLTQSPLLPVRAQKGLDFGLFDFVPPDDPSITIADE